MTANTSIFVLGGEEKPKSEKEEWHRFTHAKVLRVNCANGDLTGESTYRSPPEVCPEERASILFKSGTLAGGRLYACTQTEVLILNPDDFAVERTWSHPCLNDVHHVLPDGQGGFYVVVTGLDLVIHVDAAGEIDREWSTVPGEAPFTRFDRQTDYRKVPTTKPHRTHPNFAFRLDGLLWVTRFFPRDAICVTADAPNLPVGVEGPHDGLVREGKVHFTTVDGHIVVVDPSAPDRPTVYDLNTFGAFDAPLGWCRGLKFLDDDRILVGFSRLRRTKFADNLRWLRKRITNMKADTNIYVAPEPTGIRCFNIKTKKQEFFLNLEQYGMNAIFSIL
ncbi:MAG: hypothetical protein KDC18_01900 [Alphaproteobacteria bacterium]|nr:hypothetical protein [Alphaproteobacteria bacterium]MCB9928180.1 hypothetical protein [Alphaproteobacteria bacterium]